MTTGAVYNEWTCVESHQTRNLDLLYCYTNTVSIFISQNEKTTILVRAKFWKLDTETDLQMRVKQ